MSDTNLTITEAREEGFTDAEIELLRAAGLLREDTKGEPWWPQSLDDVDWVCFRATQIDAEIAAIQARAQANIERLAAGQKALLARYGEACKEIVLANLERTKSGSLKRKSLDLLRVQVGVRASAGGPRISNELELLTEIKTLYGFGELPMALADAVQVTEKAVWTGPDAVERIFTDGERAIKLLAAPVKEYVASLPPEVDPDTGEVLGPATIPGVEIVPAAETFWFK